MKYPRLLPLLLAFGLVACGPGEIRPGVSDVTGSVPPLQFVMTRANDVRTVDANAYRGKVVALYFGYTHCPDECPTTLANLASALQALGPRAKDVRILFVTVDPARDTLPVLKAYVNSFAPEIDGLRGTDDQIARLARRYRVLYRVTQASKGEGEQVVHSSATFFFDRSGRARLVMMNTADAKAVAADIGGLLR